MPSVMGTNARKRTRRGFCEDLKQMAMLMSSRIILRLSKKPQSATAFSSISGHASSLYDMNKALPSLSSNSSRMKGLRKSRFDLYRRKKRYRLCRYDRQIYAGSSCSSLLTVGPNVASELSISLTLSGIRSIICAMARANEYLSESQNGPFSIRLLRNVLPASLSRAAPRAG